jgi:hypothetical protein
MSDDKITEPLHLDDRLEVVGDEKSIQVDLDFALTSRKSMEKSRAS